MTDTLSDLLLEARSLLWDGSTIARGACAARITDFLAADRQARQAEDEDEKPAICNCKYEMEKQWVCERCGTRWAA